MAVSLANLTVGWWPAAVAQCPDNSNACTRVVAFNDNDIGPPSPAHADRFQVRLDIHPVPEPASPARMPAGLALADLAIRFRSGR